MREFEVRAALHILRHAWEYLFYTIPNMGKENIPGDDLAEDIISARIEVFGVELAELQR